MALHYRTIWISNTHMRTKGCKADWLRDFLDNTNSNILYLVGDTINFSSFNTGLNAPLHGDIVQRILNKAKNGTRVMYIPGQYDANLRKQIGTHVNGIDVTANALHTTVAGRKFLVVHGDEFENIVRYCDKSIVNDNLGSQQLLPVTARLNQLRRRLDYKNDSHSTSLKYSVKNTVGFLPHNLQMASSGAGIPQLDGIICGHIHPAAMTELVPGITYSNCGDWVESCSALVEDVVGELAIIHWRENRQVLLNTATPSKSKVKMPLYSPEENNEWLFFTRQ